MDAPVLPSSPREHAELIPARMCNEFVYCPRLFHLEHVQGLFVESADTIEGEAQHERAAKRSSKKAKPALADASPEGDAPPWSAPNTLSFIAPKLGVVGELDAIEVDNDEVIVVEAKRGRAHHPKHHPMRPATTGQIPGPQPWCSHPSFTRFLTGRPVAVST